MLTKLLFGTENERTMSIDKIKCGCLQPYIMNTLKEKGDFIVNIFSNFFWWVAEWYWLCVPSLHFYCFEFHCGHRVIEILVHYYQIASDNTCGTNCQSMVWPLLTYR